MTVDFIIPCVCCEHPPSVDDRCTYGMPILEVTSGVLPHQQWWSCKCASCGRGGTAIQYKSPYLALKAWNEMQTHLYEYEKKPIQYEEKWKDTCERLGWKYDQELEDFYNE